MSLVSVIVPVYNRAGYVCEAIESILNQSYREVEVVLINDGSTDDTIDVLMRYQNTHPTRVIVIDQKNSGQVVARNNGIKKASGKYIAFLDSDDTWAENKLELQMPLFSEKDVGLVYSGIYNIDENGKLIDEELCDSALVDDIYYHLLIRNRMTGGTVVVSREALDKVGLFDEAFSAAENWDLWLRISKHFKARLVNQPLVYYRKHPGNMSKDFNLMISAKEAILNKHTNPNESDSKALAAFVEAQADLAYVKGVYHFSNTEYSLARGYFKEALSLVPDYKDAKIRLARTLLGRPGNKLLSKVKGIINGQA